MAEEVRKVLDALEELEVGVEQSVWAAWEFRERGEVLRRQEARRALGRLQEEPPRRVAALGPEELS